MGLINDIEVKTRNLVNERVRQGRVLMERIKAIKHWTKEPYKKNADVAMKIARSFHLTAQMNIMVQLLGYTRKHSQLQMLGDELALLILKIPDGSESYEMDFYTMQHPLQPHFWAIFCSLNYGIQCLDRLKGIYDRSTRTNTGLPIVVAEKILRWHIGSQQNIIEHGWFWKMKQDIMLEHDLSLG
ncbi:hypothetical protein HYALB_00000970 [Hymenoscyphus albidus]|uniref:Uncharacterized protein n=1 Tax=Hymenoscyphus albidus TaxID=595503 RepID=A0A9N9M229_9HELO|nr:hypothetical protein HYALB_00000970 [Hymenoscyphus albidus]